MGALASRLAGAAVLAATLALAACGGGGGGDSEAAAPAPPPVVERPATRSEAMRFLGQATFGPTEADIARVTELGYAAWIDEQFAKPPSRHRAHWEARDATLRAAGDGRTGAGTDQVLESFWKSAVTGEDQLRQRVAFALSQIMVVSTADDTVRGQPRALAAWLDMLASHADGRYRELLEDVSRHPVMGLYLSHLRNQKADARTGRVPDENYAREVMQLFSIGLVELNEDGSPRTGAGGAPLETYDSDDVSGLAQVFTGWSWACPDWPSPTCFRRGTGLGGGADPDRAFKPMLGYELFHSTDAKRFLGVTVPAQDQADPATSLRIALDRLASHPNVGPFIGRQLIQRLVTSNPSPAYVRDVSRVWADNGRGERGDLKAVVKAILLHPEARRTSDISGLVREPVLRLSTFLRAFGATSDSGHFRIQGSSTQPLGQTPLASPSVFNFWRPGYVAPGSASGAMGLVAPELQAAHESSTAGYINTMRDAVSRGLGATNGTIDGVSFNRRDVQPDLSAELALADDPAALVDLVLRKLLVREPAAALRDEIVAAVASITIPTSASAAATARRNRVNAAVLLVLASPEYGVAR